MTKPWTILVAAYFATIWSALACSVDRIPHASELVDRSELILLVKIPDIEYAPWTNIEASVVSSLKGAYTNATISIMGYTTQYDGPNDRPIPYDFVRPGGRHGDCFAMDYKKGGIFLLMIQKGSPYWAALAPVNEEVTGADDPWVIWVKARLAETEKKTSIEQAGPAYPPQGVGSADP